MACFPSPATEAEGDVSYDREQYSAARLTVDDEDYKRAYGNHCPNDDRVVVGSEPDPHRQPRGDSHGDKKDGKYNADDEEGSKLVSRILVEMVLLGLEFGRRNGRHVDDGIMIISSTGYCGK